MQEFPRGSILSPILFNKYASDQPVMQDTLIADYVDDKAIISINENLLIASSNFQSHLEHWYSQWRIKLNHSKSIHMAFTPKRGFCPPVSVNSIPLSDTKNDNNS